MTGSVSINNNQLWDDPEYVIPMGFSFTLFDMTIDSLYFGIGVGALVSTPIDSNYEAGYLVLPFEADLVDRGEISGISQSPISYKLEGTAGSRILKVEWENAGFYEEAFASGTHNDYINIQLWLFEGSNDIEMRCGPNMVTNPFINYSGETGADLTIYNSLGQTVIQIFNIYGHKITLSLQQLSKGIYYIRITEKNTVIASEKLICN